MSHETRRKFLLGTASAGLLSLGCGRPATAARPPAATATAEDGEGEDEVSPPEDLMREHGVLNRILLVYEESARRLDGSSELPIEVVSKGADIVRRFIEDYHGKLEEDFVFPRFEKAHRLVDLVATLRRQHLAGRRLTDAILGLATPAGTAQPDGRKQLAGSLRQFVRMYRPHEAREDTVLFPAFRSIVTPNEFDSLGERFEDQEHALFGKEGFEGVVETVAALERQLGTYDLDLFTPT